jgi:two-component system, LytTR family, response regulator
MTTRVRALVVDDEAVARRRVIRMAGEHGEVDIVGEAGGGREALSAIERLRPELVFLDVQMPDMDGFEVLKNVPNLPAVIFVTAYDQYALRAFEACAVDYLLKPYETDRFNQAVDRAVRWIRSESPDEDERLRSLLREVLNGALTGAGGAATGPGSAIGETQGGRLDRFLVKRGGKSTLVRADDVDWIESDGNYVSLHVGPQSHLVRSTLASCADKLDPQKFVRIHRRYIVNIDRVKEIQPWFGGDSIVVLNNGHKLRLSRNFREHFHSRVMGSPATAAP